MAWEMRLADSMGMEWDGRWETVSVWRWDSGLGGVLALVMDLASAEGMGVKWAEEKALG